MQPVAGLLGGAAQGEQSTALGLPGRFRSSARQPPVHDADPRAQFL
jgi:hypothetical protein